VEESSLDVGADANAALKHLLLDLLGPGRVHRAVGQHTGWEDAKQLHGQVDGPAPLAAGRRSRVGGWLRRVQGMEPLTHVFLTQPSMLG
jgi:hypothetical protein